MCKASVRVSSNEVDRRRFSKAMVGEVLISWSSFCMQSILEIEGFYNVRASAMGPNMVLLEDVVERALKEFMEEDNYRWKDWFKEVRGWKENETDSKRMLILRVFGVPCLAWNTIFFTYLENSMRDFHQRGREYD